MDKLKHLCDAMAACSAFVTVMGWLPVVLGTTAAALSISWYCFQWYQVLKGKKK